MRRKVFALTALAALLFAGCSSGGASSTPTAGGTTPSAASPASSSTSTNAASPTIPAVAGSPSPASTNLAGQECQPSDLKGTAVEQGAEGTIGGTVRLTNTSRASCDLKSPGLELRDSTGGSIASSEASSAPAGVTVPAGATAFVTFVWRNYCGQDLVPPLSVVVSLGGGGGTLMVPVSAPSGSVPVPRCDAPGEPSTISISDVRLG